MKQGSSFAKDPRPYDKVVYLLQGGGALGSYQVGVCEGLLLNNREPNWVIGTSIGAINGAIIVGNEPHRRKNNFGIIFPLHYPPF